MQEVTFDLQTITPLITAGANLHMPELRAASLRGLMRSWQRALVGGGGKTFEEVIKTENSIFGSTQQGSVVQVRVLAPTLQTTRNIAVKDRGMNYLLWPSAEKTNRNISPRPFIQKVMFQVKLSIRQKDSMEPLSPVLKQAIAPLWLLVHLGGIGYRSRHGAGSLELHSIVNTSTTEHYPADCFSFNQPSTITELKSLLEQGIQEARNLYSLKSMYREPASFEILSSNTCNVWLFQKQEPWNTSTDALNGIGNSLRQHKFPILQGKLGKRIPSPLTVRVAKLQQEKYVGIALLFKTKTRLPSDYELLVNSWLKEFQVVEKVEIKS